MDSWFKRWFPTGLALVLAVWWLWLPQGRAQVSSVLSKYAKVVNFKKLLSYYEGQYQGQARSMLMGEEAHFGPDGKTFELKGMKLEMYHETGERELVVQSPECVYNDGTKIASSAARIVLQTIQEGRYVQGTGPTNEHGLFTEGRGFLWDQLNSRLILSNDVHTVLHRELLKSPASATNAPRAPGATNAPLDITSGHADISISNRVALYFDHVKVDDPRTQINSELLTIRGLASSNNQVESVVAEKSVVILNKQDQSRATGDKAVYTATNDVVTLTGSPAIENAQGKMSGKIIVLNREQNLLETHGEVHMTVNGSTNANAPRQPLQLWADEARANLTNRVAWYTNEVRAEDAKMRLSAQWLEVQGAEKGGGVERLHAKTGVVIINKDDQSHASGEEAVYEATNNIVTLTGNPLLENAQGKMAAVKLVLHRTENELFATDHVRTEVQYGARGATNRAANAAKSATNAPLLVFADSAYIKLTNKYALYTGGVRADDSKMLITSEKLTVQGALNTNRLESLVAEQSVTMTNRQDHSRATGDKAVYDAVTEVVTLTGTPMLENEQGKLHGETIILNRAANTLEAMGGVKTEIQSSRSLTAVPKPGTTAATVATNKPPAEPMLVTSDFMKAWLTNRVAEYYGTVRVESERMLVYCDKLTVISAPPAPGKTNSVERIIATGEKVVIITKRDNYHISGTNAVYIAATDTVEITGSPLVEGEKGNLTMAAEKAIIWDRTHNTIRAFPNIWGTLEPKAFQKGMAKTNAPAVKAAR